MTAEWFYEYDGKKCGPVPADTLRHLAAHGAITADTVIWKAGLPSAVKGSQIKNLFLGRAATPTAESTAAPREEVRAYLERALDAVIAQDEDSLKTNSPPLSIWASFTINSVLLGYEIISIKKLPAPAMDASTPPEKRTKPVRQLFLARVMATVCDRPSSPTTLTELTRPNVVRRELMIEYECKEFEDNTWLFFSLA